MTERKRRILDLLYEKRTPNNTTWIKCAKVADILYEDRWEILDDIKELNQEGYIETNVKHGKHIIKDKTIALFE